MGGTWEEPWLVVLYSLICLRKELYLAPATLQTVGYVPWFYSMGGKCFYTKLINHIWVPGPEPLVLSVFPLTFMASRAPHLSNE